MEEACGANTPRVVDDSDIDIDIVRNRAVVVDISVESLYVPSEDS